MSQSKSKSVLITGGTGPLGQHLVDRMLTKNSYSRVVVYSHSENSQSSMKAEVSDSRLRFFLGDIRDLPRLKRAMNGIDTVVHLASLNNFEAAEYDPFEFIETNINGTKNVIEASLDANVERVISISTDKAVNPASLYGATRLVSEKLIIAANHYATAGSTKLSVVRLGNLLGGNNSIVETFRRLSISGKPLPVTDLNSSRFWMTIAEASEFIESCTAQAVGGEIFVPKLPSMNISDLARTISPNAKILEEGLRPGEKLHESLFSAEESRNTIEQSDKFIILPAVAQWGFNSPQGKKATIDIPYSTENNTLKLSSETLRRLVFGYDE
jgi:UDP-N-acetylglucosamine 4,6-dehydratase